MSSEQEKIAEVMDIQDEHFLRSDKPLIFACERISELMPPDLDEWDMRDCSRCGQKVWVEHSRTIIADTGEIVCEPCLTTEEREQLFSKLNLIQEFVEQWHS